MTPRSRRIVVPFLSTFALLGGAMPVHADIRADWSGFGTVGAGRIFKEGAVLLDYDEHWSFNTDTMIGAQLDVTASNGLSLTAQAVSRGYNPENADREYRPEMQMFFGAWQVTDDTRLRAGLLRTPFFIYSDSIDAGYAYPWVRPPIDVYSTLSQVLSQMEGMDVSYVQRTSFATIEYRVAAGQHYTDYSPGGYLYELGLDPVWGFALTADFDHLLLRYSLYRASNSIGSDIVRQGQEQLYAIGQQYPAFNEVAASLTADQVMTNYHVLGFQYERDRWSLTSEANYCPSPGKEFAIQFGGAYVSLARQIGAWSPYVLLSWFENKPDERMYDSIAAARETEFQAPYDAVADQIRASLDKTRDGFRLLDYQDRRKAVGVRYDFSNKVDAKVELEHYQLQGYNVDPDYPTSYNMLTVVVDWVL